MRAVLRLIVATLLCAAAGCQTKVPASRTPPTPDPARLTGFSQEEISSAANLYTLKCGRCHQFYNPAQYNDVDWESWMRKMSKKARLKPEEQELLSRYLA